MSMDSSGRSQQAQAKDRPTEVLAYRITKDKLPSSEEVQVILDLCERRCRTDLASGRKMWVIRYMLVHVACASGLRASEIAALRVDDFQGQADGHVLLVRQPRGAGNRKVNLGPKLARHIEDYLRVRQSTWGEILLPDTLLLPGRHGKPYSTAALYSSFRKAVVAARIDGPYSLRNARHFYSAFLMASTGDLRYVQRQMGHTNQSMTLLYQDVVPHINRELTEVMIW